jgi:hypothetical protein
LQWLAARERFNTVPDGAGSEEGVVPLTSDDRLAVLAGDSGLQ